MISAHSIVIIVYIAKLQFAHERVLISPRDKRAFNIGQHVYFAVLYLEPMNKTIYLLFSLIP
jgi:hypothetical protein